MFGKYRKTLISLSVTRGRQSAANHNSVLVLDGLYGMWQTDGSSDNTMEYADSGSHSRSVFWGVKRQRRNGEGWIFNQMIFFTLYTEYLDDKDTSTFIYNVLDGCSPYSKETAKD